MSWQTGNEATMKTLWNAFIGVVAFTVVIILIALIFSSCNDNNDKSVKQKTVVTNQEGLKKFKELTEISTTTTTTTIAPQIKTQTLYKENPDLAICAQGFYDALAYYDTYRLIFNTMLSARVLDSQEMEDQAIKERNELEEVVVQLYKVLEDSCGSFVGNRWLDDRWG